jgi:hypothetical protein
MSGAKKPRVHSSRAVVPGTLGMDTGTPNDEVNPHQHRKARA